jgi:hypothetical protein
VRQSCASETGDNRTQPEPVSPDQAKSAPLSEAPSMISIRFLAERRGLLERILLVTDPDAMVGWPWRAHSFRVTSLRLAIDQCVLAEWPGRLVGT